MLDIQVKWWVKFLTDHHLVVCALQILKSWPNQKSCWLNVDHRISKIWGNSLFSAWQQSSDNFQRFLKTLKWNGCCSNQLYFHQLRMNVGSEKKTVVAWNSNKLWKKSTLLGSKMFKKPSELRNMLFRLYCQTGHHLICCPSILRCQKLHLGSKSFQRTNFGGVWLDRCHLFIGKQSI